MMPEQDKWQKELSEYIRQGEPERSEKSAAWQTAIGLQAVDGLKTGYIDAGGSSIILTGKRKGCRAIVIVLGSSTSNERDENAARLLEDALGAIAW